MSVDSLSTALHSLQSDRPDAIAEGLEYLCARMASLPEADFRGAVEELCSLFYVDTADRPDLQPLLDQVVAVLAAQGPRVVAQLLELMKGSDIKSHLYLARTLAAVGHAALPALRRVIATEDPYSRSFALFAVGKVHDPAVREALPEVIGSLMHPDKEVRDSAARALGKIAEAVPADVLAEDRRHELFEVLFRTLADVQPATRCGAPDAAWRTTIASIPIASIVCTVSSRLSPFFTDDVPTENVIVSAPRRLAAVSNDRRVRVESS